MARRRTKVTKGEMVRQAIEGGATMPIDGIAWIKEKFGIDMKPNNFSNFKSTLSKGSASSVARQPTVPGRGGSSVTKRPNGRTTRDGDRGGIRLEELATLRILVDRVGPQGIAEAVGLLTGPETRG